jgi:hypothetical protein
MIGKHGSANREVRLDADVQRQVKAFLDLHREVLLDYWEERIDTDELPEV